MNIHELATGPMEPKGQSRVNIEELKPWRLPQSVLPCEGAK